MYLDYWGLAKQPFENAPSDRIYRSPQHEEALMRLVYSGEHRKGVAMLSGDVGSGKTTVAQTLMKQLSQDKYDVQMVSNPALDPADLLRAILLQFGEKADSDSKTILLSNLEKRFLKNADRRLNNILIIDEAHVIDNRATLDELRMMLNFHINGHFLTTLILLGQPPLLDKISALQPLKERIGVKFHIDPLDLQNTVQYIIFKMKNAGATRGAFSKEAISALYDYSGGLPLRINNICDRCLLIGFMRQAQIIDSKIVYEAIEDIK